jgi:hypothetical protein
VLGSKWAIPAFAITCVALVVWTFGSTASNEFVNLDDDQVILNNTHYRGLDVDRLQWMFTTRWMGQYQPVTWISYALDMLFGGHSARTYHTANILWHSVATVALFLLIRRMLVLAVRTLQVGSSPRSASVNWISFLGAVLWALHPLRVEPVSWVTGRNDLLSGFLAIVGVLAWLRYASSGNRSVPDGIGGLRAIVLATSGLALLAASLTAEGDALHLGRLGWLGLISAALLLTLSMVGVVVAIARSRPRTDVMWYCIAWAVCTLSLLAKPWLLTLPLLLLVLDAWPLGRLRIEGLGGRRANAAEVLARARTLVLEKAPFAIVCLVLGVLGMWAKRGGATLIADENLPTWGERMAQSCLAIGFYLFKTVAPADLKPIVDRPAHMSLLEMPFLGAAVAVAVLVMVMILVRRRSPATTVGFLCYVLILAPSLGFVAYGFQLVADRYSYLAMTPLFILLSGAIMMVWSRSSPASRIAISALACSLVLGSGLASRKQAECWRTSESLWMHTLSLGEAPRALANLALVLDAQAHRATSHDSNLSSRAIRLSDRAVELARDNGIFVPEYLLVQGTVRLNAGQVERAETLLREFNLARPENLQGLINLGLALNRLGRFQDASRFLQRAVRSAPSDARAWRFLGHSLDGSGLTNQALRAYERAASLGAPDGATEARIMELRSIRRR